MSSGLAQLSVLLVEDTPADSKLLQLTLRSEIAAGTVIIQTVRKFKDALNESRRFSFDCVLLDLGLPDGLGVAGIEKLRAADPHTAIIVLTGLDDEASAQQALRLGAQEYLVKGRYDAAELLTRIRHAVLRNRRSARFERDYAREFLDATRDPLTGLIRRGLFEDRVQQLITGGRGQQAFALLQFSFDGLGAAQGPEQQAALDELLQQAAQVFAEQARASDSAARLDPHLFALLLTPLEREEQAREILQQALLRVRELPAPAGTSLAVSTGLAFFPADGETLAQLQQALLQPRP